MFEPPEPPAERRALDGRNPRRNDGDESDEPPSDSSEDGILSWFEGGENDATAETDSTGDAETPAAATDSSFEPGSLFDEEDGLDEHHPGNEGAGGQSDTHSSESAREHTDS